MFEHASGIRRAEILIIGNEVISGLIQETNSRFLSGRLHSAGVDVCRVTSVGDDRSAILSAAREALDRVDIVITTGGLGSTHDDITSKVMAELFESGFVHDENVHELLKKIFKARGREIPPAVLSQCKVPEKAEILLNEKGTAPGLLFRRDGKSLYTLPGIPLEMEHLFEKYIFPQLASDSQKVVGHRILLTTGLSEASLWELAGPVDALEKYVTVASLPSHLGVKIRLSAVGGEDVASRLAEAERILRGKISSYIYGTDQETLEGKIGELLLERGFTLAVAESCTGGLIGHRLTQVPGSSAYFMEGAVTYSNAAKSARLGVDPALIEKYGAVSREVALAMAKGIRQTAGTHIGLSTTGIAGPGGGSEEKPVGLTYIAVADAEGEHCGKFIYHQDRVRNKERTAQTALNLLRLRLLGLES